jgi:purine-binding chemotaxis protein CheW
MRPLPCEPLAGGPGIVSGVSVIRGDLVPVVEIGRLLGTGPSPAGRYVTIRVGSRRVALAVDSVLGVREIACDTLSGLPPLLGGADSDAIAALAVRDAEFLVILQAARLVPEPVWALLEDLEPA